jgi:hypothetical protein
VCLVITVAMAVLLRDFVPYPIIFMTICVFTALDFPVNLNGQFISGILKQASFST